jgi:hypothetical protein
MNLEQLLNVGSMIYLLIISLPALPIFTAFKYLQDSRERNLSSLIVSSCSLFIAFATFLIVPLDSMLVSFTNDSSKGVKFDGIDQETLGRLSMSSTKVYTIAFILMSVYTFVAAPFCNAFFGRMGFEDVTFNAKVAFNFHTANHRLYASRARDHGSDWLP